MKKTWDGNNSLINNKRKQRKQISALEDDSNRGTIVNDPQKLPNIMNSHFSTAGMNLASKAPHSNISHEYYLHDVQVCNLFFFRPVIPTEIEEEINNLSSDKTYGLYSVPTKILKSAKYPLSVLLAQMINRSFTDAKYPSKLKNSKITAIFKSEYETDPTNYRPIFLLSVFNRIFEKLVYKRLIEYGFRSRHATEHAIQDILNTIQSNMGRKQYTCAIFIDLKKAFDTVNHIGYCWINYIYMV